MRYKPSLFENHSTGREGRSCNRRGDGMFRVHEIGGKRQGWEPCNGRTVIPAEAKRRAVSHELKGFKMR